jgi:formate hydrogenlyase subunit 3/multisubunit Na+/H+ antiporter MnhD subunit
MGMPPFPIFFGKFYFLFNLIYLYNNILLVFFISINIILTFYYLINLFKIINSEEIYSKDISIKNKEYIFNYFAKTYKKY